MPSIKPSPSGPAESTGATEPGEGLLRIGELATRTDKTIRALHLYEERGLLVPARRTKGGFRLYDAHNLARIRYIDRLQALGLSLNDIAALLHGWTDCARPSEAMATLADLYRARLTEVTQSIERLTVLRGELQAALGFVDGGCRACAVEQTPAAACGACDRATSARDALPLIDGLAGR